MTTPITVALEEFQRDNKLKGLTAVTVKDYATKLEQLFKFCSVTATTELDQNLIDDYKLYLIEKSFAIASINSYLRAVRRFVHFCAERDYCPKLDIKLVKGTPLPKPTLSDNEVNKIIQSVDPTYKDSVIALTLIATGIRSATLCNIRVYDVVDADGTLILRHTKNKRPYILPLPEQLLDILKRYIDLNAIPSDSLLFPSDSGTQMTRYRLWTHIKRYLQRLGINQTGVHKFRHTFAKSICKNGLNNAIMLMRILGHSSVQQAQNYVNLYGTELRECMVRYNPLNKF